MVCRGKTAGLCFFIIGGLLPLFSVFVLQKCSETPCVDCSELIFEWFRFDRIFTMTAAQPTPFANALAQFSLNLYRQVGASDPEGNIFMSPLSISFALAMTYAGASGNTKAQMKKVLCGEHVEKKDDELHSLYGNVMEILNKQGAPYKLHLANRVYAFEPMLGQLLSEFSSILKQKYGSDLQPMDFGKGGGEFARGVINSWVSEKTNTKIPELIPSGALSSLTRLVLVNAIYFKGDWKTKFDAEDTATRPFYASPNKEMQVQMMQLHQQKFHYSEKPGFQVLGMPYSGEDLFMYIWLPKERFGLQDLEKSLTAKELLDSVLEARANCKLGVVAIPKFKLEEFLSLEETLKALGAPDMFDAALADFSKVNGQRNLFVSRVIHKAFIEVNEEGTEAAAATAVIIVERNVMAAPRDNPAFVANHPFLFAIVDKRTTSILFLGRYTGK